MACRKAAFLKIKCPLGTLINKWGGPVRHKLLSSLAVICSVGGAHLASAADMALKAPPVAAVAPTTVYNWAGWYAGGNVGYGWGGPSDPNVSFVDPGVAVGFAGYFGIGGNVTPDLHPAGVIGGGEVGYNWTLTPSWVAGLVADFQGSGIKGSATNSVSPPLSVLSNQTNSEQIDWFGTVRAKLGYAQNNWLFYATGGLAYGRVETSGSFAIPPVLNLTGSNSATNVGWAAGGGFDYGLTSNWIVGVEYLYVDLGRVSYTEVEPTVVPSTLTINNRATAQIVRASLDYKF
jgi:outer membrane immunogenic protein